ncbi:MAG: hypothetical protein FWH04_08085 [Oscillospiraceae bacterium]|nr:hypothetical protein [Oscillospiraceae bacterium]
MKRFLSLTLVLVMMAVLVASPASAEPDPDDDVVFSDSRIRLEIRMLRGMRVRDPITYSELANITSLRLGSNVKSLDDLKYFKSLTSLTIENLNHIKEADLSGCPNLERISLLRARRLRKIDVSNNTKLRTLELSDAKIDVLELSNNTELEELMLENCSLAGLDLSNNTKLKRFKASVPIRNLELSGNTELRWLDISAPITELDLSNNTKLETLLANNLRIAELDLSSSAELTSLRITNTHISMLDLSGNTELTRLVLSGNLLSVLDVNMCQKLASLSLNHEKLKILDVSMLDELKLLDCRSNQLTSLKLPHKYLGGLDLRNNFFDIRPNSSIMKIIEERTENGSSTNYLPQIAKYIHPIGGDPLATTTDIGIDLYEESINLGDFIPTAYSVDGGKKWKKIKFNKKTNEFIPLTDDKHPFNSKTSKGKNNFSKLLNKGMTLWVVDKYNTKNIKENKVVLAEKGPAADAVFVKFPKTEKRQKKNPEKLRVYYYVTTWTWILGTKNYGSPKSIYEWSVSSNRKIPDGEWMGLWRGLPIPAADEKVTYFFRVSPTTDGEIYTPSSKPWKVTVKVPWK